MKKLIMLAAPALTLTGGGEGGAEPPESSYDYTIIDGEVTIVGFTGEPAYIDIPDFIEGCPVTEVRDNAFYNCHSLKWVRLPDTVQKIGHHSFYACYELETAVLPDGLEEIGMGCFCGCSELKSAAAPSGIQRLPESCFRACTSLKEFTVPDKTEAIGDFCFSGCTSLENVSIGSGVTSLGDCSFYMCSSMDSLYVPSSVKNIGICAAGYIPTEDGADTAKGFTILGDGGSEAKNMPRITTSPLPMPEIPSTHSLYRA